MTRVALAEARGKGQMAANAKGSAGGIHIVTANRLADGVVVFLAEDGQWSEQVADALIAVNDEAAKALLAAAERDVASRRVVGPYLIDAVIEGGVLQPVRLRERIRANGPTAGGSGPARQAKTGGET